MPEQQTAEEVKKAQEAIILYARGRVKVTSDPQVIVIQEEEHKN